MLQRLDDLQILAHGLYNLLAFIYLYHTHINIIYGIHVTKQVKLKIQLHINVKEYLPFVYRLSKQCIVLSHCWVHASSEPECGSEFFSDIYIRMI